MSPPPPCTVQVPLFRLWPPVGVGLPISAQLQPFGQPEVSEAGGSAVVDSSVAGRPDGVGDGSGGTGDVAGAPDALGDGFGGTDDVAGRTDGVGDGFGTPGDVLGGRTDGVGDGFGWTGDVFSGRPAVTRRAPFGGGMTRLEFWPRPIGMRYFASNLAIAGLPGVDTAAAGVPNGRPPHTTIAVSDASTTRTSGRRTRIIIGDRPARTWPRASGHDSARRGVIPTPSFPLPAGDMAAQPAERAECYRVMPNAEADGTVASLYQPVKWPYIQLNGTPSSPRDVSLVHRLGWPAARRDWSQTPASGVVNPERNGRAWFHAISVVVSAH
jgi:hypothetical protein